MSKATHLHSILRGRRLLLQLHHPLCPAATSTTSLPAVVVARSPLRPVAAPGPANSCCTSLHTSARISSSCSSSSLPHSHRHHTCSRCGSSQSTFSSPPSSLPCSYSTYAVVGRSSTPRSRPSGDLHRPLSSSYCSSSRCLHTSRTCSSQVSHHADQHHQSDQQVARATLQDHHRQNSQHQQQEQARHNNEGTKSIPYSNQRDHSEGKASTIGASATVAAAATKGHGMHSISRKDAEWISELPWINPLTMTSYEPGQGPRPSSPSTTPSLSTASSPSSSNSTTLFPQPIFQKTRHNYVFSIGASGFAKNPNRPPILTPEEDQAYFSVQVGEDSYFRRHDALGVADGVGGWSGTSGANPALYSRKLMHYAFVELEKYDNIEEEAFYDYFNVDPVEILEKSYEQSTRDAKKEGLIGSSTACLAILRDDELRIANLGDCGISVIRNNEFIFRTEEQQHSFNYPYQLGTGSSDRPTDAQVFTVKVKNGDIVVMGTDGIFDNLFDEDILEEVIRCIHGTTPNEGLSPYGTGLPAATSTTSSTPSKGMSSLWSGITSGAAKLASTSASTIAAVTGKASATANATAGATEGTIANTTPLSTNPASSSSLSTTESPAVTSQMTEVSQRLPSSAHLTIGDEEDVEPGEAIDGGLSPIAAAAVAAAESSALPLSASLYGLNSKFPSAVGTGGTIGSSSVTGASTYLSRSYERKIPEPCVISDALAKRAKAVAEDSRHHGSPFQSRAMQEGLYYQGGKRDDMSVLVAIIKVAEDSPDRR